jgi:hypothetical protein
VKHCGATVIDVVSIPVHPLECVISRTARRVSVIHTAKQLLHLSRMKLL